MLEIHNLVPAAYTFSNFQAACDHEAENFERAFILQLLGSSSSTSSKEVCTLSCLIWFMFSNFLYEQNTS